MKSRIPSSVIWLLAAFLMWTLHRWAAGALVIYDANVRAGGQDADVVLAGCAVCRVLDSQVVEPRRPMPYEDIGNAKSREQG